jgi:integrase
VRNESDSALTRGGIGQGLPTSPPVRSTNRLTDRAVRAFIANSQTGNAPRRKLSDGGGLYLVLTRAGTPVWRVKYRIGPPKKLLERVYSIGPYPAVSVEGARSAREAVKAHLREGRDPLQVRRQNRAAAVSEASTTFGAVATEWLEFRKRDWSAGHFVKSRQAIARDILPVLGKLSVASIEPAMVSRAIEAITRRGSVDTASKVLHHTAGIFRFAQARGLCRENPAIPVRELLPKRRQHGQRPALLDFPSLGDLLRRMELATISPVVRIAHRLVAFTGARIGNVITAEWTEFSLDASQPLWIIPRKKMKMRDRKHDHRVLLGPTIAAELRIWRSVTGGKGYLFPSPTGRPHITHEALEKSLRVTLAMDGLHSVHGFRSSLSTLAKEAGFSRDCVELTLDHVGDSEVVRAYDRGERLVERRRLAQWWDAELSRAQHGPEVIPLSSAIT